MPITSCLDGVRVKVMEQMARRREECCLWTTCLCPVMEERLSKFVDDGFGWDVYKSLEFVFEVKSPKSQVVDLKNRLFVVINGELLVFHVPMQLSALTSVDYQFMILWRTILLLMLSDLRMLMLSIQF